MRPSRLGFVLIVLLSFSVVLSIAQPVPVAGWPQLRRESRSAGILVNYNSAATVYYVVYLSANDPGALTANQIKNNTGPATGRVASGSFGYGDASYSTAPPPIFAPGAAGTERGYSVFSLAGVPHKIYVVAEDGGGFSTVFSGTVVVSNNASPFRVGTLLPPGVGKNKFVVSNCSPSQINFTATYTGVDGYAVNRVRINWGDGTFEPHATIPDASAPLGPDLVLLNPTEMNKAFRQYQITVSHVYTSASNTASNPPGSECTFHLDVDLVLLSPSAFICPNTNQDDEHTVWDDPGIRGTLDVNPDGPDPSDEEFEVCETNRAPVDLIDASAFNCTDGVGGNELGRIPPNPNNEGRWVQFVYGAAGTTINIGGPAAPSNEKLTINGVDFDNTTIFPIYGPVEYVASPVLQPFAQALPVQMPSIATTGQIFVVQMRSWNTCRPYDRVVTDNNGLNPVAGAFDVGVNTNSRWFGPSPGYAYPGNGALFPDASEAPVVTDKNIIIIDAPPAPIVPNKDVCSTESRALSVTGGLGAGFRYRWYSDAALATQVFTGVGAAGHTFTPTTTQAPTGRRTHFWVTVESVGPGNCKSPATEVRIIRRSVLPTPPTPTGPTNLCPGSTYVFSIPSPPGNVTIVDPSPSDPDVTLTTEHFWTVPSGWTINSGQGTQSITVTTPTSLVDVLNQSVTVTTRYTDGTSLTPATFCGISTTKSVNLRARPIAVISPDPAVMCATNTLQLNGNPTGFGTLDSHSWSGTTSILDAVNIQEPTVQSGQAPGAHALTYTVTYEYETGVACSGTDNITVTIDANPAPATVGADQLLCQPSLTSNPLGGSNASPGTGTWTLESKPALSAATNANFSNQTDRNATFTGDLNGQYILRWTVVNGNCTSSAEVSVDFGTDPGPQDAGPAAAFCGTTGSLAATPQTIGSGTWLQVAGPIPNNTTFANITSPTSGISLNTTTAAAYGTYTYRWTVTSGTCLPARSDEVDITFSRPATVSDPVNFTICIDPTAITPIALTGTVGDGAGAGQLGRWERISAGAGLFGNGANPGAASVGPTVNDQYTPAAAEVLAGSVQLRLVAVDPDGAGPLEPCANVNSAALTITIDQRPNAADAGSVDAICNGETASLNAVAVTNDGIGTWSPAAGVADVNDPTTTVTGLTANTTFTWTVRSALGSLGSPPVGSCASTSDDVLITVRPLPAALDPHPTNLCETVEGTFTANNVTLAAYNDGVTGIVGSAQRTVTWYADAFDQINNVNPIIAADITNGETLFTRVIDTSNSENCVSFGQVIFEVNPQPTAILQNLAFCEEFPAGSGRVNNIDLTTAAIKNNITNSAADRTIFWYTSAADAEADVNRVATPADVDIVGDSIVFASVVNDLTGCSNVAQVNLLVKPLPADQPILGSSTPCVNGTELYRVSQMSGAEYIWTIPPQFTPLGGGGLNDFYVLLEFPNAATADVKVQIVLNGCSGNELTKTIAVSTTPPGFAIVQPAGPICEDGTFTYSVSPNNTGSSSYSWEIFKQSDGLPGGGVVANGQTTGSVLINVESQDVFIRVTESNASGCAGPSQQIPVTVRRRPTMDDRAVPVCGGDAIAITLVENATSPVVATTFEVQVPSILPGITPIVGPTTGIVGPNGIANDTYRNQTIAPVLQLYYRVKPISAAGCYGDEKSIILDIKAEPLLDANLGKTICSGVATGVTLKTALGFLPADKYEISRIAYNSAKATPLTALPPTNVLLNNDAIALSRWENLTSDTAHITYYVRPFNSATGCFGNPPIPVLIIVQPDPMVTPLGTLPDICSGDVLNVPLTSSNISNPQFVWTVFQVNGNITGATGNTSSTITDRLVNNDLTPGSVVYEVHATDLSSSPVCTGPAEFITVPVKPSPATQNITATVCSDTFGGSTYVEDLNSLESQVSTEAGVSYTWFTNQGDFAGSQIAPAQLAAYPLTNNTTVFVRVENGSSSCGIDAEVKYTVNPMPQLTATPLTTTVPGFNISCNGNTDGQINVSAIFGTGHTFSKDGVSYIPAVTFSSLGAGTYTIHTRNAEGCEDAATVTLLEPPAVTFTTSAVSTSCFNDPAPDGEVVVTGAGGAGSLNYFLLQDPSNTSGQLTGTFTGLRAGSYSVRVEDGNGCNKVTPAIAVGQPPELKLTIAITSSFNGHDVSCTGATDGEISVITIAGGTPGGAGYTYTVDQDPLNLTGQTSGVFSGLRANDAATPLYTITVTDENGCSKTSLPVFLLDPIPLFPGVVGFDKNVCAGGDASPFQVLAAPFGGVGNYTYQWEESNDNVNFTAVAFGTDAVFDPPALTDTTYYRRMVFSGTCAAAITDTVKVVINPLPVATFSPSKSPVCEGDFFTLDFDFQTGTAPYTFEYNDGGATISRIGADQTPVPILNYMAEKTYTLTRVRDFYGCEPLTLPAAVTVPIIKLNPNFTITGPVAQCSGGTFQFEWTVDPDVDYVWIWNDGDYDTIPANSRPNGINQITHDFFSPNTSGDLKIPVFLSAKSSISSCGPVQSKKDVTIFPAIFANVFNIKTEICSEEAVEFTNLTRGGTSHRWFYRRLGVNEVLDERIFSAPTSQVFTLSNTTTTNPLIYEIVYQVSNANCNAEVVMRDTVYRSMQAAFDTLAVSKYIGGNAFASFINNSTPANDPEFRYEWEFGNGSNPGVHSGYAPPNPVQYNAVGDKEVRLTVTNIVAETNGLTCFDVEAKTIKILMPPLTADFRYTPQAACFPADISITRNLATGDFYQWTLKRNGETLLVSNDSLPTFRIVNSGEYVIELFTRNSITGQTAEADNEDSPVRIVDIPFAAFETRPEVVFAPDADGIQMYNGSSGANEYFWDFDNSGDTSTEFEPKYFYQQEGRYTIRLVASANFGAMDTDGDGIVGPGEFLICRDTAENVVLAKEGGLIKIPNAFTPDAGGPSGGTPSATGRNDVFLPVMKGIEEFQMQIFDRWGTLIFESRDKNQGWDGYDKNGQLLPSGVYVYKLTLRLSNDQRTTQVGDVTLIR